MIKLKLRRGNLATFLGLLLLPSGFAFAFSPSSSDLDTICEKVLGRPLDRNSKPLPYFLLTRFANYSIEPTDDYGYLLEPIGPPPGVQTLKPAVLHIEDFDREPLQISDWKVDGAAFQFYNVGYRNMEPDARFINGKVADFVTSEDGQSGRSLKIEFGLGHLMSEARLRATRWYIHNAVLNRYQESKDYLNDGDYFRLTWPNVISGNSDVFALAASPAVEAGRSLDDRLAMTIQISYFGDEDYFKPTQKGILEASGFNPVDPSAKLPFEFRLRSDAREDFRRAFYARFEPQKTCEMVRYARFRKDIPQAMHDRFLLVAFRVAERRGMKYIVASGDPLTTRLFRRYGFQMYADLPTDQTQQTESLSYLEIGGPEYRKMIAALVESGQSVEGDIP